MCFRRLEEIKSYLDAKEQEIRKTFNNKSYQVPLRLDNFLIQNKISKFQSSVKKYGYDFNKPCT